MDHKNDVGIESIVQRNSNNELGLVFYTEKSKLKCITNEYAVFCKKKVQSIAILFTEFCRQRFEFS